MIRVGGWGKVPQGEGGRDTQESCIGEDSTRQFFLQLLSQFRYGIVTQVT